MPVAWKHLLALAQAEVSETLQALPAELQSAAQKIPIIYEQRPGAELVADGVEPDTLGLFVGGEFVSGEMDGAPLPPEIILFLENLWSFANGDDEIFREEVRITLMHELGHYLGLDEDDMEDRGID